MSKLRRYKRREDTIVTAIQLSIDTDGFTYRKWGGVQTAAASDWLVENGGDVYTVNRDVFAQTYQPVGEGRYRKSRDVWACVAEEDGKIRTKEGETHYVAGDLLVFNDEDATDGYAMKASTFDRLYEPAASSE